MAAGQPGKTADPLDFPFHRPLGGTEDTLKAGAACVLSTPLTCIVKSAGSPAVRLRGKITGCGGPMKFEYLWPGGSRASNAAITPVYNNAVEGPHADETIVDGTEFCVTITPIGESEILVTFTPDGDGEVDFFHGMQA